MTASRKSILILISGFAIAALLLVARVSKISHAEESCFLKGRELDRHLCSDQGKLGNWSEIAGLDAVKLPLSTPEGVQVFLVKKELVDLDWVKNPGWLGYDHACTYGRRIAVQGDRCGY